MQVDKVPLIALTPTLTLTLGCGIVSAVYKLGTQANKGIAACTDADDGEGTHTHGGVADLDR